MPKSTLAVARQLLTPPDHVVIMIEQQSQMASPLRSIDVGAPGANVSLIARSGVGFKVSRTIYTLAAMGFSRPLLAEITDEIAECDALDRTATNAWETAKVIARRKVGGYDVGIQDAKAMLGTQEGER